jgi:cyclopropane fatty-acyl-phospholipid synthase-like methyltransferase
MNTYDKIWKQEKPAQLYKTSISDHVLRLFYSIKAQRILDIGAGDGTNLIFLAKQGFQAHGLEISKEGVKKARKNAKQENCLVHVLEADMFDSLPYKDGFFDAVYSYQTINHGELRQIQDLLKEIYRVLRQGGIFSVKTIERKSFRAKKSGKDVYIDKEGGKRYRMIDKYTFVPMQGNEKGLVHYFFSEAQLKREVCKLGFRCLDSKAAERYIIQNYKKK